MPSTARQEYVGKDKPLQRRIDNNIQLVMGVVLDADGNPIPGAGIPTTQSGSAAHGAVTAIPTGAGQAAGTASVAARATRIGALIQNYSNSAETLWFGYASGVSAANGVQLLAGQSCPIGNVGQIFFFSVAGTATGVVTEDYN